jgi:ribosomal protein S18 acetylase RimI-like enzyme
MSVEIRVLTKNDAAALQSVAEGVFDDPVQPRLTAEFLDDPRHALCVAIDDGTIVGMASAVRYVHPDKPSELWINEVGVAPTHQRRGLAKAILTELLAFGKRAGCREAWVLTDEVNGPARALYASVGGEESLGVVMVTFPL